MFDAFTLDTGLRAAIEVIDNRADFKLYMQNYAVAHASSGQKVLRREGPWQEGFVRPLKHTRCSRTNLGLAGCAYSPSYRREARAGRVALAELGRGYAEHRQSWLNVWC